MGEFKERRVLDIGKIKSVKAKAKKVNNKIMLWSVIIFAILTFGFVTFSFGLKCREVRQSNIIVSMKNYMETKYGYTPLQIDSKLRLVTERAQATGIKEDEFIKDFPIVNSYTERSLFKLCFVELKTDTNSVQDLEEVKSFLFDKGVGAILVTLKDETKYISCVDSQAFENVDTLLYYDAGSLKDDQSDVFLKALQSALYQEEYKVFYFDEDKYLYVTPSLGKLYNSLDYEDYYYNLSLIRLLHDIDATKPFTTMCDAYRKIIDTCIDYI